mmetsp:Transcript_230/g.749  ORF Transcript_230/g.749 Transcript_230/m.749 type:complete len:242 (-) Transcript_230:397-1122(-)
MGGSQGEGGGILSELPHDLSSDGGEVGHGVHVGRLHGVTLVRNDKSALVVGSSVRGSQGPLGDGRGLGAVPGLGSDAQAGVADADAALGLGGAGQADVSLDGVQRLGEVKRELARGLVWDGAVERDLEPREELGVRDARGDLGVGGDLDVRAVSGGLVGRLDVSVEGVVLLHSAHGEVDSGVSLGGGGNLLVELEPAAQQVLGRLPELAEREGLRHRCLPSSSFVVLPLTCCLSLPRRVRT